MILIVSSLSSGSFGLQRKYHYFRYMIYKTYIKHTQIKLQLHQWKQPGEHVFIKIQAKRWSASWLWTIYMVVNYQLTDLYFASAVMDRHQHRQRRNNINTQISEISVDIFKHIHISFPFLIPYLCHKAGLVCGRLLVHNWSGIGWKKMQELRAVARNSSQAVI